MEENEILEAMDYEAIQEKQYDELTALLEKKDRKTLQQRLEEMNEFDVAEFLTEIDDNRMPMVFRLLSKETAARNCTWTTRWTSWKSCPPTWSSA